MESDQATARARAEARRAKILARQKDRISSITGVYAKHEEPVTGCDQADVPVPTPVQATAADAVQNSASKPSSQPASHQQQQDQAVPGHEQLQALMAAMERQLQHAQAMQAANPQVNAQALELLQRQAHTAAAASSRQQSQGGVSNASSSMAADALQSLLGTAAAAATAAAGDGSSGPHTEQQQASAAAAQQQQPPMLLQLGPQLARSVKQTQLFRLLAAALLAYAVLTGWQLGLPPVALLVVTDLAVVLAGAVVLPAKAAGSADGGAGGAAGGGDPLAVPWRLRTLDVVSLVPGLRELLDSLKGYSAVATAVSQDFAAYVVVCGLLLTTSAVPAAVHWGLRI